ncbi:MULTISPECIES: hypothetical protein [unclassified Nocardioides]|nr:MULTISPECIES: hypothetical protein [unclassified Nocardioides]TQK68919.1 hypothetical protein FBY23_0674 [Nocardioides sp. SLBN-35]WGY01830.1 hypothetical protein QI633_25270 [Nocardioides sp. QY071]
MKKLARKTAFVLAALITTAGIVSLPASAEADTGWTWRVVPHAHR